MGTAVSQPQGRQRSSERPGSQVRLAISPVGPGFFGLGQGYHSSVAVNNHEFSFSRCGIDHSSPFKSHTVNGGASEVFDMGTTEHSPQALLQALGMHFEQGSYDLLRKNCNSFSDCALYFLVGRRLDEKYKTLDQIAADVDKIGLVRMLTWGDYRPNPKADGFRTCVVPELVAQRAEAQRDAYRYALGERVQVLSVSYGGWVDARVVAVHRDGRLTLRYEQCASEKDVHADDLERYVRPRH